MKRIFVSAMTMAACMAVMAQSADEALQLNVRCDKRDTQVAVSTVERVTFPAEGGVSLQLSSGEVLTYGDDEFVSLRFDDYRVPATGGVGDVAEVSPVLTMAGDVLTSRSADIIVYNNVAIPVAATRGRALSVASLPAGVYYAVSNGHTLKFVRQ
ncbi:MAG: hypothetical protein ACI30K_07535 [Muribaculaceae bacterium]